jgi:hypothetical protein
MYGTCNATTLPSGGAVICSAREADLVVVRSQETLCRLWNIKGTASRCNHDAVRTHGCSFCGVKTHHAFSWTCQQKPVNAT